VAEWVPAAEWEPAAADELDSAAEYYDAKRPGLSEDLLFELKKTLEAVESRPLSFPRLLDVPDGLRIRRALLHRFPFAVVFLEMPNGKLRVIAFAHARRRPGYWLSRVS
jgi:toxin ParE1/3/4